MTYYVKRCNVCNHFVHVHKKGSKYIIKDACEHLEDKREVHMTNNELKKYIH